MRRYSGTRAAEATESKPLFIYFRFTNALNLARQPRLHRPAPARDSSRTDTELVAFLKTPGPPTRTAYRRRVLPNLRIPRSPSGGSCGSRHSIAPTRARPLSAVILASCRCGPSWSCSATPARHHQGAAMANTATSSPDTISDSEFQEFFARYPALIAEISDAKGGRHIPFRALRSSGHPAAASDNPTSQRNPARNHWPAWTSIAMARLWTPLAPGTRARAWISITSKDLSSGNCTSLISHTSSTSCS
jgi:hypothetical protein